MTNLDLRARLAQITPLRRCRPREAARPVIRVAIRGYIRGVKQFEAVDALESGDDFERLAETHARRLLALPGGDKHMIEIEFLDEPRDRFFRIGTDPAMMVHPIEVTRHA